MSPELGQAIRAAMKAGVHVALVDRPGETERIPLLQAPMDRQIIPEADEAALVRAIELYTAGGMIGGASGGLPAILCCTDSKRDACCAKYGFATFKSLAKTVDPARFQLLQSTHLGGCRFAASLLVLPIDTVTGVSHRTRSRHFWKRWAAMSPIGRAIAAQVIDPKSNRLSRLPLRRPARLSGCKG